MLNLKSRAPEQERESIKFFSDKILRGEYVGITDNIFEKLSEEIKLKHIKNRIENNLDLSDEEFNFAPDNLKLKYLQWLIKEEYYVEFNLLPDNLKIKYIELLIENGLYLSDNEFNYTPENNQMNWYEDYKRKNNTNKIRKVKE